MDYITEKTKLEFKIVTATYISVSNNKKLDKPLCGYIFDSENNQPISFATIHIKGTSISTMSNEKGYFELKQEASNEIEISHINYEKTVLEPLDLYQEKCPTIKLKIVHYQLDEVQTEVYLTKGISKKTNGTFEIKPKKFGLLPGLTEPDVFQTMQQLPGITSVDETVSNINVRGGTHDQNLFLWNGIRLFQTGHFYGLISVLNPNLAQKISISKNGSSAFFSESISSVIDISTISKLKDTTSSFGVNMINFDFNTTLTTSKNSSLQLSARRSLTDVVSSPTYRSYYNRIFQNTMATNLSGNQDVKYSSDVSFYFYDATATFNQKIKEKTNVALSLITISNQLDVDQNKTENNTTIYRDNSLKQRSIAGSFSVDTKWNKTNSSKIIAYGSFYKVNSESQSLEGTQISNQENKVLDTNILIRNSHVLNENFTFNNGYQFNEIGIQNFDTVNSPQFSRTLKDVLHNHAIIGELNYEPEKRNFYASFGIRQNYFSQFNRFITEPRLQFNYHISNTFQLELLAEAKNQTSSQIIDLQKDFLGIEKRRWMLSNNQDFPIIKSNQASLGFTFKKKNWLITLDNFYKNATGITSQSQNFQNQLEFVKTNGNYTIWGSEILIQKQFNRFISWATYTYTNNNYSFEDYNPSKFSNNFENKHQVNFGLIYDYKNLKIALGGHWFTGKPTTLPLNNTISNGAIVFESPNSSRLMIIYN
ncbi:MAG: TonB-dependent receptor [Flavobacteriaceae bacterium]|nr:TonB-dependent receptor [Flavobacteriaceae bacterium]